MPHQQLMAEQWKEFERRVMPPGCSAIQRQEMRRAFYAGAQSILFRVIDAFAPESEATDADLELMNGVHQELIEFGNDVKAGRA